MTFVSLSLWSLLQVPAAAPATAVEVPAGDTCTLSGTFFVEDEGKRVAPAYAVVFVSTSLAKYTRPAMQHEMVQKNQSFIPSMLVMHRGDTLTLINAEDGSVRHEAHADRDVNLFTAPASLKVQTVRHAFNDAGETFIRCLRHDTMKATVLTVPTRFHAQVSADGTWSLTVPSGGVQVSFWSQTAQHHNLSRLFVRSCEETVDFVGGLGKPLPPENKVY